MKRNLFGISDASRRKIVIGTETWLDKNIKNIEIFPTGYKVYRKDRKDQVGGGVLIAVKSNILSNEVEELQSDDKCEIIWAKGTQTLYICSFYNPKTSDENSLKSFDTSIRRATHEKCSITDRW